MRNEIADLELYCKEIIAQSAGKLAWNWDDYIGAMLAVFKREQVSEIFSIFDEYFSASWDCESVKDAPAQILQISDELGGIRDRQYLFTSQPDANFMVYAAWWPWGDGETYSLRIAPVFKKVSDYDYNKLIEEFCEWFE